MESLQTKLFEFLDLENIASNTELILRGFLSVVNQTSETEIFLEKLFACSGNADRIAVVKEHFQWQPLQLKLREKFKKNAEVSQKLIQIGDQLISEKNLLTAIRAYNLASLFSLPQGPELEQSSHKSKFLFEFQLAKCLINDIALVNNCSKESQSDSCLESLNGTYCDSMLNMQLKDNAEKNVALREEISRREKYCEELFTLKSINPTMPAVHADVEVRVDPKRGRGLYAKFDIPLGTTLLVETPFVAGLAKALEWDMEHCHHCFKQLSYCTPCSDCVFTIYCNDLCRDSAKDYHQYECPCLPELHLALKDEILSNFHIVFKLVCILGPTRLYNMFKKNVFTGNQLSKSSTSNEQCYDSDSYHLIHSLTSKIYPREGYYFVLMSLVLTKILKENSPFFQEIPSENQTDFEDFISEMLLHNFETFRKNTFGLSQIPFEDRLQLVNILRGSDSIQKLEVNMSTFAAGILASGSLLNHSCDPNVFRVTGLRFCITAFVSLKFLKKDEELRISYGPTFGSIMNDATSRQTDLIYGYDFKCDCIACSSAWEGFLPTGSKLNKLFACPDCSNSFPYDKKATEEFLKCKLTKDFRCKVCGRKYCQSSFMKEVKKSKMVVEIARKLVLTNNPLACVGSLKTALEVLGERMLPPNSEVLIGQILLEDSLNLIISLSETFS